MVAMTKRVRELLHSLEDLPVQVTSTETTGSCHLRITLEHAGRRRFFFCGMSPSDHRATKNFKAQVTRWVKETPNGP